MPHLGVLHKLSSFGIGGNLMAWLTSYLSHRSLCAVVGGQQSSLKPIGSGVPQGSILGPTLFLTYVNDCEAVLPAGVGLAVYADDTTLYQVIPSQDKLDECCSAFQQAVDAVEAWGARWKIRFEPSKSQVLTVSHHRHPWKLPPVRFHGISVPEFDEIQLLVFVLTASCPLRLTSEL